jgi:hypothetical protein
LWRYLGLIPGALALITGRSGDESSGLVGGPKRGRTALTNAFNNQRRQ